MRMHFIFVRHPTSIRWFARYTVSKLLCSDIIRFHGLKFCFRRYNWFNILFLAHNTNVTNCTVWVKFWSFYTVDWISDGKGRFVTPLLLTVDCMC